MQLDESVGAVVFEPPVGAHVWEPVGAIVEEPMNPIGDDDGMDIGFGPHMPPPNRYGAYRGGGSSATKAGTGGANWGFGNFLENLAGGFFSAYQMREARKMQQAGGYYNMGGAQQQPWFLRQPLYQPQPYFPPRQAPASTNVNTLLVAGAVGIAALAVLR